MKLEYILSPLLQDLSSTNIIEVCCALTVACKLINKDMLPALLPQVLELVQSKRFDNAFNYVIFEGYNVNISILKKAFLHCLVVS